MKVAELKQGMLIEGIGQAKLCVISSDTAWGPEEPMLQATWSTRSSKHAHSVKFAMYLGTREELSLDKSMWGRRYAFVDGQIMLIDREAWRYIQPVKETKRRGDR